MKISYFVILVVTISVFVSCDQELLRPDPIPDPSKFAANQTILEDFFVKCIAFGNDGSAWIGTTEGLIHYSQTHSILYNDQNSMLTELRILDIAVDSKDNIWIGSNGLLKFDGKRFTHFTKANSDIPVDHVSSLAIDSNDNVWVASSRPGVGGLAKYSGDKFEVYTPENSPLPAHHTEAIAIDSEDNLWASAMLGVNFIYIIRISGETWTIYDSNNFEQKIPWITDLDIDSQNRLCGAIDFGLAPNRFTSPHVFRFNGDGFDTFTVDSITGWTGKILVDNNDRFWYSFGYGYAYYNGTNWEKTISEVVEAEPRGYYKTNYNTFQQAPDGNIWIGTSDGIIILEEKE
jgi:ligand-binding sensor domain-containing protein